MLVCVSGAAVGRRVNEVIGTSGHKLRPGVFVYSGAIQEERGGGKVGEGRRMRKREVEEYMLLVSLVFFCVLVIFLYCKL